MTHTGVQHKLVSDPSLSMVLFLDSVERWTRTGSVPIIPAFLFYAGF
jgi:hypothetical protein